MQPEHKRILAAHLVLACVPLAIDFFPSGFYSLSLFWVVSGIPYTQIMLLALWVAMMAQPARERVPRAVGAVSLIAAIYVVAHLLLSPSNESPNVLGSAAAQQLVTPILTMAIVHTGLLMILVGVMSYARRWLGYVLRNPPQDSANSRLQFSLFGLMGVLSVIAVLLGLARGAFQAQSAQNYGLSVILELGLTLFVFVVNMFAAVWATLGPGPIGKKLLAVFGISGILGLSLATAIPAPAGLIARLSSSHLPAALAFTFSSTLIIVGTLLYARKLGYRLVPWNPPADDAEDASPFDQAEEAVEEDAVEGMAPE